jgi:hypothetical protein
MTKKLLLTLAPHGDLVGGWCSGLAAALALRMSRSNERIDMSTSIEYQFHNLTGGTNNPGLGLAADGDIVRNGGSGLRTATARVDYARLMKSGGGLALLLALGVIGIPFLVYFIALGATTVLKSFG